MFHACESCGGHGPIEVRMNGTIPASETTDGEPQYLDDYETTLCAYCKADIEDLGVEVEKLPAGTL